jgi:hypothetical protein
VRSHRADLLGRRTHHSRGIVDQVRTTLTTLIAEVNAAMPTGEAIPSAEVATNAFNLAVTGKRNKVRQHSAKCHNGDDGCSRRTTALVAHHQGWILGLITDRWGVLRSHAGTELAVLTITARPRRSTHRASPQCRGCVEAAPLHIAEAL